MTRKIVLLLLTLLVLPTLVVGQPEEEDDDLEFFGLDAEELLFFISAHLAAALALLTFVAYKRSHNTRLIYVTVAFGLFSLKLFIQASELFIEEIVWLEPLAAVLDFVILLIFFIGMVKR